MNISTSWSAMVVCCCRAELRRFHDQAMPPMRQGIFQLADATRFHRFKKGELRLAKRPIASDISSFAYGMHRWKVERVSLWWRDAGDSDQPWSHLPPAVAEAMEREYGAYYEHWRSEECCIRIDYSGGRTEAWLPTFVEKRRSQEGRTGVPVGHIVFAGFSVKKSPLPAANVDAARKELRRAIKRAVKLASIDRWRTFWRNAEHLLDCPIPRALPYYGDGPHPLDFSISKKFSLPARQLWTAALTTATGVFGREAWFDHEGARANHDFMDCFVRIANRAARKAINGL